MSRRMPREGAGRGYYLHRRVCGRSPPGTAALRLSGRDRFRKPQFRRFPRPSPSVAISALPSPIRLRRRWNADARAAGPVNLERSAKRSARCNDPEIASKEQQRFVRGGDHSKSAGCFYVGRSEGAHGLGPGAEDSRSESRNSAEAGSRPLWAAIPRVAYHFNRRTPNSVVLGRETETAAESP